MKTSQEVTQDSVEVARALLAEVDLDDTKALLAVANALVAIAVELTEIRALLGGHSP